MPVLTDRKLKPRLIEFGKNLAHWSFLSSTESTWLQRSEEHWRMIRNAHSGGTCVIVGNGPSLRQTPLDRLAGVPSFGLNRCYLLFNRTSWRPTWYVAANPLVASQFSAEIREHFEDPFIVWEARSAFSWSEPVWFRTDARPGFYGDRPWNVWPGGTVTYTAMQFAYWLGFAKVILVGVDHRFSTGGKPGEVEPQRHTGGDHFDANYFGNGVKWQLPDLGTSERAYRMARSSFDADDREIVDCTVDGNLRVFRRSRLEDELP